MAKTLLLKEGQNVRPKRGELERRPANEKILLSSAADSVRCAGETQSMKSRTKMYFFNCFVMKPYKKHVINTDNLILINAANIVLAHLLLFFLAKCITAYILSQPAAAGPPATAKRWRPFRTILALIVCYFNSLLHKGSSS